MNRWINAIFGDKIGVMFPGNQSKFGSINVRLWFGYSVAAAGDLNGDGGDDLLIGAPRSGETNRGAVSVFGTSGRRRECFPRQRRMEGSAPVAPMGLSYSEHGFCLRATAGRVPFLGKIAPETEVKPHDVPLVFSFGSIHPNPFRPAATIEYSLPAGADVSLCVYDVRGYRVRTLVNTKRAPGRYAEMWDGTNDKGMKVGSGVYFIRLEAGGRKQAKKIVRIK